MRRAKTYFCYEALLSSCFVLLRDFFIFFKHIFVLCFVWRETCLAFFAKYRSPDKVRKQTANQLIVYMSLHVFSPFFQYNNMGTQQFNSPVTCITKKARCTLVFKPVQHQKNMKRIIRNLCVEENLYFFYDGGNSCLLEGGSISQSNRGDYDSN